MMPCAEHLRPIDYPYKLMVLIILPSSIGKNAQLAKQEQKIINAEKEILTRGFHHSA